MALDLALDRSGAATAPAASAEVVARRPLARLHIRVAAAAIRELAGLVGAVTWGAVVLAVLLKGPRGYWFFYDGDSVLMPMLKRSLELHQPAHWSMSSVLFLFPEIPVYLLFSAVTDGPRAALLANALFNLMALYLLTRAISQLLRRPGAPSSRPMMAALAAFAAVIGCALLERGQTQTSFQLVSMFFTTTYYYGAMLCLFAVVALALVIFKSHSSSSPYWWASIGMAAAVAVSTWSDPTTVYWVAVPVPIALATALVLRRCPRRAAAQVLISLACGFGVGMIARMPFGAMIFQPVTGHLNPGAQKQAADLLSASMSEQVLTVPGVVEIALLAALLVLAWLGLARAHRAEVAPGTAFAAAIAATGPVVLVIASLLSGDGSTRHLQPIYFLPAIAVVIWVNHVGAGHPHRSGARRVRALLSTAAALLIVTTAGAVGPTLSAEAAPTASGGGVGCLENWIAGRDLQGVGGFWTSRELLAYGSADVNLLQVTSGYQSYLWLVNRSAYADVHVSYVVTSSVDQWQPGETVPLLGKPAAIVRCPGFDIYDFAGTAGQVKLNATVAQTAATEKRLHRPFVIDPSDKRFQ